jgi:hypothetical protein
LSSTSFLIQIPPHDDSLGGYDSDVEGAISIDGTEETQR